MVSGVYAQSEHGGGSCRVSPRETGCRKENAALTVSRVVRAAFVSQSVASRIASY